MNKLLSSLSLSLLIASPLFATNQNTEFLELQRATAAAFEQQRAKAAAFDKLKAEYRQFLENSIKYGIQKRNEAGKVSNADDGMERTLNLFSRMPRDIIQDKREKKQVNIFNEVKYKFDALNANQTFNQSFIQKLGQLLQENDMQGWSNQNQIYDQLKQMNFKRVDNNMYHHEGYDLVARLKYPNLKQNLPLGGLNLCFYSKKPINNQTPENAQRQHDVFNLRHELCKLALLQKNGKDGKRIWTYRLVPSHRGHIADNVILEREFIPCYMKKDRSPEYHQPIIENLHNAIMDLAHNKFQGQGQRQEGQRQGQIMHVEPRQDTRGIKRGFDNSGDDEGLRDSKIRRLNPAVSPTARAPLREIANSK